MSMRAHTAARVWRVVAPLSVQTQVSLVWGPGVESVPCQQPLQTWTYSVCVARLHVCVPMRRSFAPKIAV